MINKLFSIILFLNFSIIYGNSDLNLIVQTDFHNNIPDELNNEEFLNFWSTFCRKEITKINDNSYIGMNNECILTLNDLYCSGSNSTRQNCIEFYYGLASYDNDYDLLTESQRPNSNSIQALPLIPFVLVFYVAPAMIQIIGEITFKILEQRALERQNRELYYSKIVSMNYNNINIQSSLRNNFCITSGGFNRPIYMLDCNQNNANQRFTSELIDSSKLIYIIKDRNGLCLDVEYSRRSNGANVLTFTCNNNSNQYWVKDIANRLHPMHAFDKCLDIARSSINNNANIIIYNCNADVSNQKWV